MPDPPCLETKNKPLIENIFCDQPGSGTNDDGANDSLIARIYSNKYVLADYVYRSGDDSKNKVV